MRAWAGLLTLSGTYGDLLDYVIFAVLVFYVLTIAGLFVLRRKRPEAERPYRAVGYPVLPAIYSVAASLIALDLLLAAKTRANTWPGVLLVLAGVPVFFYWNRRRNERGLSSSARAGQQALRRRRIPGVWTSVRSNWEVPCCVLTCSAAMNRPDSPSPALRAPSPVGRERAGERVGSWGGYSLGGGAREWCGTVRSGPGRHLGRGDGARGTEGLRRGGVRPRRDPVRDPRPGGAAHLPRASDRANDRRAGRRDVRCE